MSIQQILYWPFWGSPFVSAIVTIVIFIIVARLMWRIRMEYINFVFISQQNNWILLEIKLPGDIRRSPEAMEQFLINGLYWSKGGSSNFYKKYWKGETMITSSLEIVSIGGNIHFFIHTPTFLKDLIQTQMYAQYPQVEVREVTDYVDRIPYNPMSNTSPIGMFGWEFKLKKADAIPIKTYKQWGYDKSIESLEPDQQIDPLVPLIEKIASIDPWEEIWIQFVVRASQDNKWRDEGMELIEELIEQKKKKAMGPDDTGAPSVFLTQGEKDFITAIENNTDKYAFEVSARSIYFTHRPEVFKASRINYLKFLFSSFDSHSLNSFGVVNASGYDNPWQDYNNFTENRLKNNMIERYRARDGFGDKPLGSDIVDHFLGWIKVYKQRTFILTTEELATIFHLPGGTYQSPNLDRTDVKKAQPPTNLPVE